MKDVHPEILLVRALYHLERARLHLPEGGIGLTLDKDLAEAERLIERSLA